MYSYQLSRRDYGQHRFVIHNDSVVSAKISGTKADCRGVVTTYEMVRVLDEIDSIGMQKRLTFTVPRKHVFFDEATAKKTLFRLKLKGEL